jgi:hypothetical protein
MKRVMRLGTLVAGLAGATFLSGPAVAETSSKFKADIPARITAPEPVVAPFGTLSFKNGVTDASASPPGRW